MPFSQNLQYGKGFPQNFKTGLQSSENDELLPFGLQPSNPRKIPKIGLENFFRHFLGTPPMFGGKQFEICEFNFRQNLTQHSRVPGEQVCKSKSRSQSTILQTVFPRFENFAGPQPPKQGEIRNCGGTFTLRVGHSNLFQHKAWPSPPPHILYFFDFQNFKNSPLPLGGAEGHDVVRSPSGSTSEGPLKISCAQLKYCRRYFGLKNFEFSHTAVQKYTIHVPRTRPLYLAIPLNPDSD